MMPSPNSRDSPYEHLMNRSAANQMLESFASPPPAPIAQYATGPVTSNYHGSPAMMITKLPDSESQTNDHQPTITQMTKAELRKVIIIAK